MNFNELSVSGLYINKLQMVNNFLSGLSYGKILSGECGNGKSTVMSMIDMLYSQEKCNLPEWSELKKQVNDKIPVIKVSFSDFKPGTYEDIIAQTAGMLKNLYLQYTDYILTEEYDNYRYKEYFLDVIEGKCDDLESGLERLIHMICDAGIEKNERPVLLVDEPYEPIHICEKQDYDKTKEFFKRFFHFTECQAASKMIFFNSYPINSYYAPYIYDCFVKDIYSRGIRPLFFLNKQEIIDFLKRNGVEYEPSDFDNLLREEQGRFIKAEFKFNDDYDRYFRKADFKENDYIYSFRFAYKLAGLEFEECSNTVPEKTVCDLDKIINKNRTAVSEHKKEVELRRKRYAEEKKQRYAKPFTITADFPTKYIGIRKLPEIKETEMLYRLSEKIRELYRIYSREDKDNSLYKYMQGMDRNTKTDWDCNKNDLEKQIVSKHGLSDREISIKNDYPWCQIECRIKSDEPEISMHSMIKVYASVSNLKVKEIFLGAVDYLISGGEKKFYSKVTMVKRKDTMCFWVSRRGFFLLEEYFADKELVNALPFIPYRGNLGISREMFSGWYSSYNSCIVDMLEEYFDITEDEKNLDIYDMYQYVVDMWNGKYGIEDTNHYVDADAHLLIVLLESLDIISGNKKIQDDNFLLSEDDLWGALCSCRCWADLEEQLSDVYSE